MEYTMKHEHNEILRSSVARFQFQKSRTIPETLARVSERLLSQDGNSRIKDGRRLLPV